MESTSLKITGVAGDDTTPLLNDILTEEPKHRVDPGGTTNSDDTIYTVVAEKVRGKSFKKTSRCHNFGGAPETSNGTTDNFGDVKHGTIIE